MIIVEGVDGSGKSTLCERLSAELMIPTYKPRRTPQEGTISVEASQAHDAGTIALAILTEADVIFDRSFPSEWVYGHVFKRNVDTIEIARLDQECSKANVLGVHLRFKSPMEAFGRGDNHVTDVLVLEALMVMYDAYVLNSRMHWLILDANDSTEENIDAVKHEMKGAG